MTLPAWITIGELAQRTGVATSALRFYEAQGLIHSERSEGNQRRFNRSTVRRVSVIRAAQRCGLSLDEIAAALEKLPIDRVPLKRDWERMSRAWQKQLDERISGLQALRADLTDCIGCGCLSLQNCALFNRRDAAARLGPGPRYLLGDDPDEVMAGALEPPPSRKRGAR
ncbi:MAG TPA: redox-sensitive transcriptional activator SoxR [Candidatus Caenarcaniphilales bacterium]|nr:redox-sensitive transcriptional activator SoxR [Candidatus Caenarcaniphilales bacterium]